MNIIKFFEYFGDGEYAQYDNKFNSTFWGNMAAGCLPFAITTKRFLLCFRSKYVNEPHTYGLWGGKVDNDDNIISTIKKELYEESGFNSNINLIPIFVYENAEKTFKYHNFIGIIKNEFTPILNWESDDYKWVTYNELLDITHKHPGLDLLLKDKKTLSIIKKII